MKGFVNLFRIEDAVRALEKLMEVKLHNALAIELLLLDIPYMDWNTTMAKTTGFHIDYFEKTDFTFPVAADTTARDLLGLAVIYKQLNGDLLWKDVCNGINCFDITLSAVLRITNESLSILYPKWSIELYNSLGERLNLKRLTWLNISDAHFIYRREKADLPLIPFDNGEQISLTADSLLGHPYHVSSVDKTKATTQDPVTEFFNQDNLSVNAFQPDKRVVTHVAGNVIYFYIRHAMVVEGEMIAHGTGRFIRIPCSTRQQALKRASVIHCAQECMPGRPSESKTAQILNCILYAQGKPYDKEITANVFETVEERIGSGKPLRGFNDEYLTEMNKKIRI